MSKILKASLVIIISFFLSLELYATTEKDIMQTQKDRQKTKNEYSYEQMVLVNSDESKEVRQVIRKVKEVGNDLHKAIVTFLSPADIKGTALLTWEQKDRDDDQWLYMPNLGKMQRIAKGSKKNYFMGTDFTYEDMTSEDINNFNYTILRKENKQGKDCWVIEATPVANYSKDTAYSKRILWVSKDVYVTVQIEFYDRKGELIKTQMSSDFKNIGGTIWRAEKTIMNNFKEKHKTLIKTIKIDASTNIDEESFTERFILKGLHTELK
ncbi:MAG: hypothetical protein C0187_06015 [Calditerrivibrio nitroreducens]|uniref:Uncharacterized protein TP-0789 domain-containing protein n=1 Tax=Calditerrivibrio nitroreducens TaxID=477976 RepID=A0A2J6WI97_9BACT|nr:MAG: hypothetical protein C0187_06015 [Calditerrivibrio nitroreducens]